MRGHVLWEGTSRIDGKSPIVAIATMKTVNRKTGNMVQTWILRRDISPVEAVKSRADVAICGACIHRGDMKTGKGRSCYVNVGQAPLSVWRAYHRGSYSAEWDSATFEGRKVRLGAYGDPAAIPVSVWADVVALAAGHTGYTHQWRNPKLRDTLALCQASTDSASDLKSRPKGSGSFRVLTVLEAPQKGEILCPSEQGVSCAECLMCDGSGNAIAIPVHGSGASNYNARN